MIEVQISNLFNKFRVSGLWQIAHRVISETLRLIHDKLACVIGDDPPVNLFTEKACKGLYDRSPQLDWLNSNLASDGYRSVLICSKT